MISLHLFLFFPAVQKGFDVFNALDLMENKTFLEKLKFGIGDGNLQYYLYNWKCPSMGAEKVRPLLQQDGATGLGPGKSPPSESQTGRGDRPQSHTKAGTLSPASLPTR